jgi:hypothetical protein
LNNANTFKDINTFTQGIDVNNINSINGNGTSFSVNSETLTINDRFIVLNANLESLQVNYTDLAGIIVKTHNSTQHNKGYLLWTLFDPNNPLNEDLNRT